MARCELSGKGPVVKNLVSHSNIKTKSTAHPNIQQKQLWSQSLGRNVSLKLATSTIRNVEHKGGFDAYILKQDDKILSDRAKRVKNQIKRKLNLR
ncbi:MAG: 50S ribosomal protein L28 [Bdellovibrionales bacterium]